MLEGGECYEEKVEQGHGGDDIRYKCHWNKWRNEIKQSHERGKGMSHVASWRKSIYSMWKSRREAQRREGKS